ncbi:hypothetical protein GCM10027275_52690 [Rhabdobacter roseus]
MLYFNDNRMKIKRLIMVFFVVGALSSCREKVIDPVVSDTEVNNWIYDNMTTWYYWDDKLPPNPNRSLAPSPFFESLLYTYNATLRPDGDRFSWIQENADELKASLSGESKTTGMDFRLVRYSGSNDIFGIVLYTLPGSPAAQAGFRRGDFFTQINGQKLNSSNYYSLLYNNDKKSFTMGSVDGSGNIVSTSQVREVTPVVFQEDPVFFDTLFVRGSKRIGYVVYHQFIPGPNGGTTKTYDQKLDNIFAKYKSENINELIIDFRYNGGGYVSSAVNLASLIAKGVTANEVFAYKEWNKTITPELEKEYGKEFFADKFVAKPQNVGGNLSRVFVLTSSRTASASELLINGLKPYMNVLTVGATTTGKNVGSITLSDDKKRIKWGIQPIVSKSFNSQRKSDYSAGFQPNYEQSEGFVLYPYGDTRDPLLGTALAQIIGTQNGRRGLEDTEPVVRAGQEVGSSVDRKAGGANMFYELPK